MGTYEINVPEVGNVKVLKRKGMKSIRLRVTPRGEIIVSAPWYVSRGIIAAFLHERKNWMRAHSVKRKVIFQDGMLFGNNLTLKILDNARSNRTQILAQQLKVQLIESFDPSNINQQKYIEQKIIKAMQSEAEHLLLPRLHHISSRIGTAFNQAYIKNLTGRWGSCDSQKNILLSVFLLQLPEEVVEYVIIHELAHVSHMNHSPAFWSAVEEHSPNYKHLRKQLKQYEPRVQARA